MGACNISFIVYGAPEVFCFSIGADARANAAFSLSHARVATCTMNALRARTLFSHRTFDSIRGMEIGGIFFENSYYHARGMCAMNALTSFTNDG